MNSSLLWRTINIKILTPKHAVKNPPRLKSYTPSAGQSLCDSGLQSAWSSGLLGRGGGCRGWRWVDGWQGPRNGCITKSILGFKIWSSPTVDATDGRHLCDFTLFHCSFFFVSDTFTGKSWGLQLLLYKREYKAMKKYESNSKKPGITQKHAALPLSSGGSLMVTVDRFFKYASIWPCSALCLAKARSSYSRAVQALRHTRDCWCQWSRSGRHGFIACSPAMKRGSCHSASAVNWAHSDCVNPGHVAVSLQSRTRFYLLKWWLLSWEVVLSAAVAANFVGGEKCWFIVLFFPQHQQKYGGLWKHLWRHSWFQVKSNNFEVFHKLKLILHFINILYYAITFNIYLI